MQVGFIGLGIMGSRMAANLIRAGHALTVHNRGRDKAGPLLERGAGWAETPAEAAVSADCLVTVLSEPGAVRELALGARGFLNHLSEGALWMDCSTVNPAFAREMDAAARGRGVRYLDAPISGTKGPAERGELAFLVGGAAADLEAVRPLLEAMGSAVDHVGAAGMGSALKMVYNMLLGQGMLAFVEALLLGEAQGLSREMLLDTLLGGRMTPGFLAGKKAKIATEDFAVEFPLQWLHKDLQLAVQTAYELGVSLPATHAAKEVYNLARRSGLGEADYSAVYAFLKQPGK